MSEDIVKQAQLRRQRRPKTGADADDPLFNTHNSQNKNDETIYSPRGELNQSNNDATRAGITSLTITEGSRTPRNRPLSTKNDVFLDRDVIPEVIATYPFIRCKIYDREFRALINTSSSFTSINKKVQEQKGLTQQDYIEIEIEGKSFKTEVQTEDTGADICLGCDFLVGNKCEINFANRTLTINGKITTPLLPESDLPFKFRAKPGLASSI